MSTADLHAAAFFKEAVDRGAVWLLRIDDDEGPGYAQAATKAGEVAVGLRSTENRAAKIASTVPAYKGYRPERLTLDELLTTWVPDLDAASKNVGLNWSGPRAQGARVSDFLLQVVVPSSPQSAAGGDILVTVLERGVDHWAGVWRLDTGSGTVSGGALGSEGILHRLRRALGLP